MTVLVTERINGSPEQVFDTLIDVGHHADWPSGPDEITDVSENPAQMGTSWRQRSSFMSRDIDTNLRVNLFEPGQKLGYAFDKPFPAQLTFTLEPQAEGTKLTIYAEFEPGGFFKLAGPVLLRSVKGTMEKDLQSLKANMVGGLSYLARDALKRTDVSQGISEGEGERRVIASDA